MESISRVNPCRMRPAFGDRPDPVSAAGRNIPTVPELWVFRQLVEGAQLAQDPHSQPGAIRHPFLMPFPQRPDPLGSRGSDRLLGPPHIRRGG